MKRHVLVCLLAIGCGGGGSDHPIDGAVVIPDTSPDGVISGVVTITVGPLGSTSAGLYVSFADPSGTPTVLTMTDATGVASATVVSGSSATVIIPTGATSSIAANQYMILTEMGLEPGDNVVLANDPVAPATMLGSALINLPGTFNGASRYVVAVSGLANCPAIQDAATVGNSIALTPACLNAAGTYDILALALDGAGKQLAFTGVPGLTPPATNQVATTTLGSWRTDLDTMTLAATNAPTTSATVQANLSAWHEPIPFPAATDSKPIATAGSVGLTLTAPRGSWDQYEYDVVLFRTDGLSLTYARHAVPTLPGVVSFDLTSDLLPFVHDFVLEVPAGHTSPTVHYVADGSLAGAHGMLVEYNFIDAGGAACSQSVITPPGMPTTFDLPTLPDALAAYRPVGAWTFLNLAAVDGTLWPDRKDFRQHWYRVFHSLARPGTTLRIAGTNGT